jgi:hypothetical protein
MVGQMGNNAELSARQFCLAFDNFFSAAIVAADGSFRRPDLLRRLGLVFE